MTLGGMLKHMAWVEDFWFSVRLHGRDPATIWEDVDWKADPDWEWNSAAADSPEEVRALWQEAVERPARSQRRRSQTGDSISLPNAPGRMVGRRACVGSWST